MNTAKHLSIGAFAQLLGVSIKTLRRWDQNGKLKPSFRTSGGHRRYNRKVLTSFLIKEQPEYYKRLAESAAFKARPRAAVYARVSASKQKNSGDLERQMIDIKKYCENQGYCIVSEYSDVASGLNDTRHGLLNLLRHSATGKFDLVVVNMLPLELIFNKYVIERKSYPGAKKVGKGGKMVDEYLTNKDASTLLVQGKPIWLGIPIYSPDQLRDGVLHGSKKGTFWFQVLASKKIRACLERGAVLQHIRLNVPQGPTGKIVADLILSGPSSAFIHASAFLAEFNKKFGGSFPNGEIIHCDFNPIGKLAVAASTETNEINLVSSGIMDIFERSRLKLEKIRTIEIPNINRKINRDTSDTKKTNRQKFQLTMLHARRQRIMKEMKRRALLIYIYCVYKTGAKFVGWDGLTMDTRGKNGKLPVEITYMPLRQELFYEFSDWAKDLQEEGFLKNFDEIVFIPPVSSDYCSEHVKNGLGLKKTRDKSAPYHEFRCTDPACGYISDRHSNAARVGAIMLSNLITSVPSPLSTAKDTFVHIYR